MRIHVGLDPDLVARIDEAAGPRGRSRFIRAAAESALARRARWDLIRSALGSIEDSGHDWDRNPAEWVRRQRRTARSRVG